MEVPIPQVVPVEKVVHYHRHRYPSAVVLPGHGQQLFLGPVAKLALPKATCPVRELRRMSGGIGIVSEDVGRLVAGANPVVDLPGAIGDPTSPVVGKLDA